MGLFLDIHVRRNTRETSRNEGLERVVGEFKVSSLLREIVVKGTTRVSAPPFAIFTRLPVPAVSYIFSYIVSTLQEQLIIYIYIYNLFTDSL